MNYIKLLAGFFEKVSDDDRLNPSHISMYVSIFQFWNANHFQNPISISRNQVMRISKIASNATYHKCIRELNEFGYLRYLPSFNPYKGSLVHLFNLVSEKELIQENEEKHSENLVRFNPKNETIILDKNEKDNTKIQSGNSVDNIVFHTENQTGFTNFNPTKNDIGSKQALVPSINVINVINVKDKHKRENEISQNFFSKKIIENVDNQKEKSCAKKEKILTPKFTTSKNPTTLTFFGNEREVGREMKIPTIEEVSEHFLLKDYTPLEAEKFFSYFESIGWLVGGKAKMKDWKAASRNWILNSKTFNQPKYLTPTSIANNLQVIKNKNYNEPL